MLTYRGDRFVKGKKFKIDENDYRFSKRDGDKLIFESTSNKTLTITEDEFLEKERLLTEKINKENEEINEIIGKVLRSKGLARKYEDMLKSHGITINYDKGQGVVLTGPNGKELSSGVNFINGPSKPGQRNTHDRGWSAYSRYAKRSKEELNKLQAMDRDDIIRKYNDLSTDEALAKHKQEIERAKKEYEYDKKNADRENSETRKRRREGHLQNPASYEYSNENNRLGKQYADSHVDYLNYLTKPDTGFDRSRDMEYHNDEYSWPSSKNPVDNRKLASINKYNSLKRGVDNAKNDIKWHTYQGDNGSSIYAAMTDDQLEAKIQKMRDDLEKEIEKLRAGNVRNTEIRDKDIENLKAKEKELDDFLRSKGIRESDLIDVKNFLKEAISILSTSTSDQEEFHKNID